LDIHLFKLLSQTYFYYNILYEERTSVKN